MTISRRSALSILIVIPLLVSCGDKQAGDADKFKQALQSYYDGHPECVALPVDFPNATSFGAADPWRKQAGALVEVGLLSAATNASGQYSLTSAGEAAIRKGPDVFLGGMTLCFARRRVTKVASFTPPAEMMGVKMSRVTYEYEWRDIAPWAKSQSLQDAFPEIRAALAAPNRTDAEGLVLTSDGWVDEHMVR